MLTKAWSVVVAVVAIACLVLFLLVLLVLNPYRNEIAKLVYDHTQTLHFGAYIDIYDLSTPARTERLFLIRPENVLLYNLDGAVYYYLESSSVLCIREHALVKFTKTDIDAINASGVYNTACTNVNSLVLLEHFLTLKNFPDERLILTVDEIHFTILDIINLLIHTGYAEIR